MDRRAALKNFVILSAGIALIPSCRDEKVKGALSLKNLQLSGGQENMLAGLSETILPVQSQLPGDAAHDFVLMMVDECYKREDQQKFMRGLEQFGGLAKKKFSRPFVSCGADQKHALLREMEKSANAGEDVNYFYNTVHSLTVQHYTSSKYYLTKIHPYEMVPGRFHGCFPVKKQTA